MFLTLPAALDATIPCTAAALRAAFAVEARDSTVGRDDPRLTRVALACGEPLDLDSPDPWEGVVAVEIARRRGTLAPEAADRVIRQAGVETRAIAGLYYADAVANGDGDRARALALAEDALGTPTLAAAALREVEALGLGQPLTAPESDALGLALPAIPAGSEQVSFDEVALARALLAGDPSLSRTWADRLSASLGTCGATDDACAALAGQAGQGLAEAAALDGKGTVLDRIGAAFLACAPPAAAPPRLAIGTQSAPGAWSWAVDGPGSPLSACLDEATRGLACDRGTVRVLLE